MLDPHAVGEPAIVRHRFEAEAVNGKPGHPDIRIPQTPFEKVGQIGVTVRPGASWLRSQRFGCRGACDVDA